MASAAPLSRSSARRVFRWFLVGFVSLQVVLTLIIEIGHPELADPQYGHRIATLRARHAAEPNRPLVLAIGSSRTELAFRPEMVESRPTDPLIFNMARGNVSQVMNVLILQRLLADGVHPDMLFVEVLPASFAEEGWNITSPALTLRDLPEAIHHPIGGRPYINMLRMRGLAAHKYRRGLMRAYIPEYAGSEDLSTWWDRSGSGTLMFPEKVAPEVMAYSTLRTRTQYWDKLQKYRITPAADRATRQFLTLCRDERIPVVLYIMPESSEFRSWYTPESLRILDAYLAELRRDFDLPLTDARLWLPDDAFWDGHHVVQRGARAFTPRFMNEVVNPALRDRSLASRNTN